MDPDAHRGSDDDHHPAMAEARSRFASWADRGASAIEYALLVGLIALVMLVAIRRVGDAGSDRFDDVGCELEQQGQGC